jgi:hypothetical protein
MPYTYSIKLNYFLLNTQTPTLLLSQQEMNDNRNEKVLTVKTYKSDKLHSFRDRPAVIETSSKGIVKKWYRNGIVHRDGDKPAIINTEGPFYAWVINGKHERKNIKDPVMIECGMKFYNLADDNPLKKLSCNYTLV